MKRSFDLCLCVLVCIRFVTSGLRCGVNEICVLLGCCVALIGRQLLTFCIANESPRREKILVEYSFCEVVHSDPSPSGYRNKHNDHAAYLLPEVFCRFDFMNNL